MTFDGKTYWIIGASEGLGRALAIALHKEGARLILSARTEKRLETLADELSGAQVLPMDVTDQHSVDAAANAADCDGLIYCTGTYDPMNAADWNPDKAAMMCETNFIGATRVLAHIAPQFAKRGTGHIVLIGSLSGYRGLPDAVGYSASKAALMHLGENLYADLRTKGVNITIASPGFIKTRLTDKNDFAMPQLMSPERAAANVLRAMKSKRLHTAFPRPFAWLFTWGRFLPAWLFYRLF
ncbi:SDR family NAD(P)-dependent oxidoreductase [Actibacterium lipolyticum]|uniref:Putative oxidoreductase n=1 Tax=Actibacterium lipolyticum TaxID=1524263 RepID=A0A238KPQ6_9RHOB|nr:SDR family NAD(P)-dependent oxidoreductase [Actibacterium lipolyticum]SMX44775.1 putative oxidoreductase [Actibacterium lipolyticum]